MAGSGLGGPSCAGFRYLVDPTSGLGHVTLAHSAGCETAGPTPGAFASAGRPPRLSGLPRGARWSVRAQGSVPAAQLGGRFGRGGSVVPCAAPSSTTVGHRKMKRPPLLLPLSGKRVATPGRAVQDWSSMHLTTGGCRLLWALEQRCSLVGPGDDLDIDPGVKLRS